MTSTIMSKCKCGLPAVGECLEPAPLVITGYNLTSSNLATRKWYPVCQHHIMKADSLGLAIRYYAGGASRPTVAGKEQL
jgi:hypothetical protein